MSGDRPSLAEERAREQAAQRAARARRRAELDAIFADGVPGQGLIRADLVGTAVMVVAVAAGFVDYDRFAFGAAIVCVALFAVGLVCFVVALWEGAQRSRRSTLSIGGWFFLAGSAPRSVQVPLLSALVVQIVVGLAGGIATVGVATAAGDQATRLAFGVLVPTFGLAICGLWAARHGHFPPRDQPRTAP